MVAALEQALAESETWGNWKFEVVEAFCRSTPDYDKGDWFLINAGYYELYYLYDQTWSKLAEA